MAVFHRFFGRLQRSKLRPTAFDLRGFSFSYTSKPTISSRNHAECFANQDSSNKGVLRQNRDVGAYSVSFNSRQIIPGYELASDDAYLCLHYQTGVLHIDLLIHETLFI